MSIRVARVGGRIQSKRLGESPAKIREFLKYYILPVCIPRRHHANEAITFAHARLACMNER
jgi:hypothetical protein